MHEIHVYYVNFFITLIIYLLCVEVPALNVHDFPNLEACELS